MRKDLKEIPWTCNHDGSIIQVGERVLFLASCWHHTDVRFGIYIGTIYNEYGPRPKVRYKTKKFIWDKDLGTGHYESCERVTTLKLCRIYGISSFKESDFSKAVM